MMISKVCRKFKSIKFFTLLTLLITNTVFAATIYVNSSTGDDTNGDGSSGNPYKTFHKSYTSSNPDDTLDLTGTFDWTSADETGDAEDTGYTISQNLTIQGQGMNNTYLQAATAKNSADRRVLTISSGVTVTIKDIQVRYGCTPPWKLNGGGIENSGTLTMQRCKITENSNTTIYDRTAIGGGIYNTEDGTLTMSGCIVSYNESDDFGAGIQNDGTMTLSGCSIEDNVSGSDGAGIRNWNSAQLTNCTIKDNDSEYGWGGGVYNSGYETMTLTNCTVHDNIAYRGGGAISNGSTIILTNCTIYHNSTMADGTRYGGGLYNFDTAIITNCTIFKNHAYGYGGGIYTNNTAAKTYMKNTICADNTAYDEDHFINEDIYDIGILYDNDYNIVEHFERCLFDSEHNITGEQENLNLSLTLENNETENGTQTLKLTAGSVAINAGGDPATGTNNGVAIPAQDQRGKNRSSTTDIGAYEYQDDESLPVELAFFTARQNQNTIVLEWQTESEIDNAGFIIKKQYENDDWIEIANFQKNNVLQGQGSSSSKHTYSYKDNKIEQGKNYSYRLYDVTVDGTVTLLSVVSLSTQSPALPKKTKLYAAYPNPFNPSTTINYELCKDTRVSIAIHDVLGRLVKTMYSGHQNAGSYQLQWNGDDKNGLAVPSGTYIISMHTNDKIQNNKVSLLK